MKAKKVIQLPVYVEFCKAVINAAGKLGECSMASALGHRPFFAGNRADVHCIVKADVLNEYTKTRGVNKTITTYPGTSVCRGRGRSKMADTVPKQSFEPFHKYPITPDEHQYLVPHYFGIARLPSAWYVPIDARLVTITSFFSSCTSRCVLK
jgi:hypothetical protein